MKQEHKALREYILRGAAVHYMGADEGCQYFKNMLINGTLYTGDAPDFYISQNNEVLIIEHFEFDCYSKNKKGSIHRQELARIDRLCDEIPYSENGVLISAEIKGKSTYKNYVDNVTRSFYEHYSQIDKYIERLKNAGVITERTNVKTMFFIEDSSPLGTYVVQYKENDHSFISVNLANCVEFLRLLQDSNRLDYVLACSWYFRDKAVWFIDRNNLDAYLSNTIDYASMEFVDFDPQVLAYKRYVSEEELGMVSKNEENSKP